jgi:adenine-specific DNA methylase
VIETRFQIPFVAELALREKQIQQNYRPVIAVHKWFARRPGSLFRSLLLSEFCEKDITESYFESQKLPKIRIGDPFMGGGIPLLEANRVGCKVLGFDINPMAWWIVREEIEHLDLTAYMEGARRLTASLEAEVGALYQTRCVVQPDCVVPVKSFFWVKTQRCDGCDAEFDLFAGYRLAQDVRHPKHVLICAACGELNEVADPLAPGKCRVCEQGLRMKGNVARGKATCPHCGRAHRVPDLKAAPYKHRLFALEYVNPNLSYRAKGRLFKKADEEDIERVRLAEKMWGEIEPKFVPPETIPAGDESDRLHRWGYRRYRDLFHSRQLLGLELSAHFIASEKDERIRRALSTNLSDLLRYQNQLCRYDSMALKVLDIFSIHGFPVGLMHAEANLLGILHPTTKAPVGSGGWTNIIDKFFKAKSYCDEPFEIRSRQTTRVAMKDEWIGEFRNGVRAPEAREVKIFCKDAAKADVTDASLDAVFTDPPYFGNVQYAELMDFCYVWLRRLVPALDTAFAPISTRNADELTGNITLRRGIECFTSGLSAVYAKMARALKAGGPLAFTFHHNSLEAYGCIAVAILDSGLTCSASIPAPAEMGGSIHITGTGSSIIDTVFICRSTGRVRRASLAGDTVALAGVAQRDVDQLLLGGVKATPGDIRCIIAGHLTRLAIWHLRDQWETSAPISDRLERVTKWVSRFGAIEETVACMRTASLSGISEYATASVREQPGDEPKDEEYISF